MKRQYTVLENEENINIRFNKNLNTVSTNKTKWRPRDYFYCIVEAGRIFLQLHICTNEIQCDSSSVWSSEGLCLPDHRRHNFVIIFPFLL